MNEPLDLERIKAYCENLLPDWQITSWWAQGTGSHAIVCKTDPDAGVLLEQPFDSPEPSLPLLFALHARTDLPAAIAELAAKDKRITELLDKFGDAISHSALPDIIAELDSLRAQLEVAKQNGIAVAEMWANNYSMLEAQLETARQEIERLRADRNDWKDIGLLIATKLVAAGEKDNGIVDGVAAIITDRDKALRVAEEAKKDVAKISGSADLLARHADKLAQQRDKAQSDLSTLRGLVDEMAEWMQNAPCDKPCIHGTRIDNLTMKRIPCARCEAKKAVLKKHTALKAGREVCPKCKGAKVLRVLGSGGDYEDWPCECNEHFTLRTTIAAAAQKKEG